MHNLLFNALMATLEDWDIEVSSCFWSGATSPTKTFPNSPIVCRKTSIICNVLTYSIDVSFFYINLYLLQWVPVAPTECNWWFCDQTSLSMWSTCSHHMLEVNMDNTTNMRWYVFILFLFGLMQYRILWHGSSLHYVAN